MKYDIELFAFGGECSEYLCTCDNYDTAQGIASILDKSGKFKGKEFLTQKNITWQLRIIQWDEDSPVEVVGAGDKR